MNCYIVFLSNFLSIKLIDAINPFSFLERIYKYEYYICLYICLSGRDILKEINWFRILPLYGTWLILNKLGTS